MARYPKYLHRCNATSWEEGICISCEIGVKQKMYLMEELFVLPNSLSSKI